MELMTPFEHLMLYAALRLVPAGEETNELVDALLVACDLVKFRDIPSGNLSGGNKRKLSIAISLIGGPQVVFLDEPSAGIDPAARRQLFDVISFIATQSAVVLTTHHLEEVDVLAHRVGIMDRGAMKCLGSLERLKNKYGDGIEVTLQAATEGSTVAENVSRAKKFMESTFPQATISEERQQRLLYVLPFTSIKLSDLFDTIMKAVDSGAHGIKDYTVQQSSLEQVFLRISRLGEASEGTNGNLINFDLPAEENPIVLPIGESQTNRSRNGGGDGAGMCDSLSISLTSSAH
jgi:ABC-type multidrug transport system ATPase subunit